MPTKLVVFKDEYNGPVVNDCKMYFLGVSDRLNLHLPHGQADEVIDFITKHWICVGKGAHDGPKAQDFSKQGYFVVALLRASEHCQFKENGKTHKYDVPYPRKSGHVAIVLPTPTSDYPYVVCGSDGDGKSDGSKKVYQAGHHSPWRLVDAPNVQYYRTPTPVPDPEQ